jgi:hypothetical protein
VEVEGGKFLSVGGEMLTEDDVSQILNAVQEHCGEDVANRLLSELPELRTKPVGIRGESIAKLELPHGITSALLNGHFRTYHNTHPFPRQVVTVDDLCGYTAAELVDHGLPGRSVEDVRAALAKHGLNLKGDV